MLEGALSADVALGTNLDIVYVNLLLGVQLSKEPSLKLDAGIVIVPVEGINSTTKVLHTGDGFLFSITLIKLSLVEAFPQPSSADQSTRCLPTVKFLVIELPTPVASYVPLLSISNDQFQAISSAVAQSSIAVAEAVPLVETQLSFAVNVMFVADTAGGTVFMIIIS